MRRPRARASRRCRKPSARASSRLTRLATGHQAWSLREIGTELRMAGEPARRASHRLLVLLVDEAVDGTLEPAQDRGAHVEALPEPQQGAMGALGLERDRPREPGAQHDVVIAAPGDDVPDQLEGFPAPPEGQGIDDLAQESVALGVAGPEDLDVEYRGRVLFPQVVALEEG